MKLALLVALYIQTLGYLVLSEQCIPLSGPCEQTCQCCDFDIEPGRIRCEERYKGQGKRCYTGSFCGEDCEHDHECYSQQCGHIYAPPFRRKLNNVTDKKVCICDTVGRGCPCPVDIKDIKFNGEPPYIVALGTDAEDAIDGDDNTHLAHNMDMLAAVELRIENPINVCALGIYSLDIKHKVDHVYLEGWCKNKKRDGFEVGWTEIPLTSNTSSFGKNKKLVKNPKNGPYSRFRVSFNRPGDAVKGPIKIHEIKLYNKCWF